MHGNTLFVSEENPLSQTYVEYAANTMLSGDDAGTGGGGIPAAIRSGATTNAPNVDAGDGWTLKSVEGINDSGVLIGVANNQAGASHAVMLVPVAFNVTVTLPGSWGGNIFQGDEEQAVASIPMGTVITTGGIWRDIQATDAIKYRDGSTYTITSGWLSDTGATSMAPIAGTPGYVQ